MKLGNFFIGEIPYNLCMQIAAINYNTTKNCIHDWESVNSGLDWTTGLTFDLKFSPTLLQCV